MSFCHSYPISFSTFSKITKKKQKNKIKQRSPIALLHLPLPLPHRDPLSHFLSFSVSFVASSPIVSYQLSPANKFLRLMLENGENYRREV
jgi:hypothetical protein